ncbi:MAG: NACHT domain-containing protein [Leptolyngbyaceae cyanobacterium]
MVAAAVGGIIGPVFEKTSYSIKNRESLNKSRKKFEQAMQGYYQRFLRRNSEIKILDMHSPVPLSSLYVTTEVIEKNVPKIIEPSRLQEQFRTGDRRNLRIPKQKKRKGIDIVNQGEHLIILGEPGGGKTTFLRSIGIEAISGKQGLYTGEKLPIFFELKFFDKNIDTLFSHLLSQLFPSPFFKDYPIFEEPFLQALEEGKFIFLLDGLDEVPKDNLNYVLEEIERLIDMYPNNQFIVSCRTASRVCMRHFFEVEVTGFGNLQIREFITKWFSKEEIDIKLNTAEKCWTLLNQPSYQSAKELAKTPLLLAFLCMNYDRSQSLPSNRASLYNQALDVILEKWAASKRIDYSSSGISESFSVESQKAFLSWLAFFSFRADRLYFDKKTTIKAIESFLDEKIGTPESSKAKDVLEIFTAQQGVLYEQARDVFSFCHLTIQEFLVARYIFQNYHRFRRFLTRLLVERRWREVFLLFAGLLDDTSTFLVQVQQSSTDYIKDSRNLAALLTWSSGEITNTSSNLDPLFSRAAAISCALQALRIFTIIENLKKAISKASILAEKDLISQEKERYWEVRRVEKKACFQQLETVLYLVKELSSQSVNEICSPAIRRAEMAIWSEKKALRINPNTSPYYLYKDLMENLQVLKMMTESFLELEIFNLNGQTNSFTLEFGRLLSDTPSYTEDINSQEKFRRQLQLICIHFLHFQPEMFVLSPQDLSRLDVYLNINLLLVRCKKSTLVSRSIWERINKNMLSHT